MFPVLSLLRRGAYNVVYVRPEMLERDAKGALLYRAETQLTVFDLSTATWQPAREIRFFTLTSSGKTPEETALALTRAENRLAEKGKLLDRVYTLLLGEEQERDRDGVRTRVVPLAVVRGVQRLVGTAAATPRPRVGTKPVFSRKLPRGVTVERR